MTLPNCGKKCLPLLLSTGLLAAVAFAQPVPNFTADYPLSFDPNLSVIVDQTTGNGYPIQSGTGNAHVQVQNGQMTVSGLQARVKVAFCVPLGSNCANPFVGNFVANIDTFTANAVPNGTTPAVRVNTSQQPGLCIGGTVSSPYGPPQPMDPCSAGLDYVGPLPLEAVTNYDILFSVNVPSLGTHFFIFLASNEFQQSTISRTFGNDTPAGSKLWFNSNGEFRNVANGTKISFRQGVISINGNGFTVPDADVVFSSSASCSTTSYDSSLNLWTTTVPLQGDDGVFLGGLSAPVTTAIPKGAKVAWSATVFSNHPIAFDWKWGAAAYNPFTSDYNLVLPKPAAETSCQYNKDDQVGTPEGFIRAIAGGTGAGGTNRTGTFTAPAGAVVIPYRLNP